MKHLLTLVWVFSVVVHLTSSQCSLNEENKSSNTKLPDHINIILIGATGDLARKYLWTAFYNLFKENFEKGKVHFQIYGGARKKQAEGRDILSTHLLRFVSCSDDACRATKRKFIEHVQYHQLLSATDYQSLADKIEENTRNIYQITDPDRQYETGRIVYMSIPPSAYAKTAKMVDKYLRPKVGKQKPWLRVVLEKPFGHDKKSAIELSENLKEYLSEDEMYRIDHYLGKTTVEHILPFRVQNRASFEPLWNSRHIERVEVVMKESVDAKGRTGFYNEVGVIRDVMQNHLTEMLCLVGMDLPKDSGNIGQILKKKAQFLKKIQPPSVKSTILGQYESFQSEAVEELEEKQENFTTQVPTFAATVMYVNSARWRGVPILLMSGKKLDVKASYVRVLFKGNHVCMSSEDTTCDTPTQVTFHIGGNNVKTGASILVSKTLPKPTQTANWKSIETLIKGPLLFYGQNVSELYIMRPSVEKEAYTSLISAVLNGHRHRFVDTASLMLSWDLWTPLLDKLETVKPVLYSGGKSDIRTLNFKINEDSLQFVFRDYHVEEIHLGEQQTVRQIPATFRDQTLISGNQVEVVSKLADALLNAALKSIENSGTFNVAFSGGSSTPKLFRYLRDMYTKFPWKDTYIWQVDERCVPQTDAQSNFKMFQEELLDFIDIPYTNIHPMQVYLGNTLCDAKFQGDMIYESDISRLVANKTFNAIVLGMGEDGHTASLFPGQPSLTEPTKSIIFSEGGPEEISARRMTMTFNLINQADFIAVLLIGQNKYDIVHKVAPADVKVNQYPIIGVQPTNGELAWYIDTDALFGKES